MPPLSNPRHERFVQALFEGHSADEAYLRAGYSSNRGNASRLKANESILARLSELQAEAARGSEVTVQSLLGELEEARRQASSLDQLSAATAAIMGKAKLAGLLRDKVEIGGGPGSFDSCDTPEAVAHALLDGWGGPTEQFRPVTEEDRKALTDLLLRHYAEVEAFIASIKARPVVAMRVDGPEARRRFGLLSNGR